MRETRHTKAPSRPITKRQSRQGIAIEFQLSSPRVHEPSLRPESWQVIASRPVNPAAGPLEKGRSTAGASDMFWHRHGLLHDDVGHDDVGSGWHKVPQDCGIDLGDAVDSPGRTPQAQSLFHCPVQVGDVGVQDGSGSGQGGPREGGAQLVVQAFLYLGCVGHVLDEPGERVRCGIVTLFPWVEEISTLASLSLTGRNEGSCSCFMECRKLLPPT
jgi:hypothetical protein